MDNEIQEYLINNSRATVEANLAIEMLIDTTVKDYEK